MATPFEIPKGTKEFLAVIIDSPDDLTSGVVEIGVSADVDSQPAVWLAATWPTLGTNVARTSAVWDTTSVALGHYQIWARVTDSPEILPRKYGTVRVV
jgi:hypothetical protein